MRNNTHDDWQKLQQSSSHECRSIRALWMTPTRRLHFKKYLPTLFKAVMQAAVNPVWFAQTELLHWSSDLVGPGQSLRKPQCGTNVDNMNLLLLAFWQRKDGETPSSYHSLTWLAEVLAAAAPDQHHWAITLETRCGFYNTSHIMSVKQLPVCHWDPDLCTFAPALVFF